MARSKALIEYIAKSVVDHPEEVDVTSRQHGRHTVVTLMVDQEDMGRVIGKHGRMANAMRAVLRVAAMNDNAHITLEIGE